MRMAHQKGDSDRCTKKLLETSELFSYSSTKVNSKFLAQRRPTQIRFRAVVQHFPHNLGQFLIKTEGKWPENTDNSLKSKFSLDRIKTDLIRSIKSNQRDKRPKKEKTKIFQLIK